MNVGVTRRNNDLNTKSSNEYIAPSVGSVFGSAFAYSSLNAATLQESLLDLYSVRCPKSITNPNIATFNEGFEDSGW